MNLDKYIKDVLLIHSSSFIDAQVYNTNDNHYSLMRLPLCLKEDRKHIKRPLVPLIEKPYLTYIPSFGLVHHMHSSFDEENGFIIKIPLLKKQYSFRDLNEHSLLLKKYSKGYNIEATRSLEDECFRSKLLEHLPKLEQCLQKKMISNSHVLQDCITPHTICYKSPGVYYLTNKAYCCFNKAHNDWSTNPCSYMVKITKINEHMFNTSDLNTKEEMISFKLYGYCFGCGSKYLDCLNI